MSDQIAQGLLSPFLQHRRIYQALRFIPVNGLVLDYGCGNGELCAYFDQSRYFGYDPDEEVISIAQNKYPAFRFVHSLEVIKEKRFSAIILLAVIEHVESISELLKNLSNSLTENGRIILTTPNPFFEGFYNIGAELGFFSEDAKEEHHQLINKNILRDTLQSTDLEIVHFNFFLFWANQLFVLEKQS